MTRLLPIAFLAVTFAAGPITFGKAGAPELCRNNSRAFQANAFAPVRATIEPSGSQA